LSNSIIPAEKRIDGMYGEIWVGGGDTGTPIQWWADVVNVSGTVTVERKPINPAGSVQTYNKRGRVTREGTLQFDKVDSRLEKQFLESVNKSLEARRLERGVSWFNRFRMVIKLDDPDSWGVEELVLMNCELWTMPLGFSLSEMRQTEMQFTWEWEDIDRSSWISRDAY
jgi:hypothetical protein